MKYKKLQAFAWWVIIVSVILIWSGAGVVFMYLISLK
jgi:hypothetical protein